MLPRIFNDVIGPIMRGPSSSHTAASWRIGKLCLELLNEPLQHATIEFDQDGAWATNYLEQGTVMGMNGGLLNIEITDPRIKNTAQLLEEKELTINYEVSSFPTQHVNTMRILLKDIHRLKIVVMAASLGGGSFQIYQINGHEVDIRGDYFELLIFGKKGKVIFDDILSALPNKMETNQSTYKKAQLINLKSSKEFPTEFKQKLESLADVEKVITINPILPIVSGNEKALPFGNIASMLSYAEENNYNLAELGLMYEKSLSGLSEDDLNTKMLEIIQVIKNSIKTGLAGTSYKDRILAQQSHLIAQAEKESKILQHSIVNKIIEKVTAIMEVKSAMEVFVANPTAGSCGVIGGLVKTIADELDATNEALIEAYFAAGIVGAYFAAGPGFSAEEHGCQVECGAASGMAAAAIVQLFGGTAKQAIDAASMAIQNMIGLICDPVADRVEVPCLGKNISAAFNAYASATMVRSGFDAVIPLNEVLQTVSRVSAQMPSCVKCSGTGGLAITSTAGNLKRQIKRKER